jgi:hypothetical protein
MYYTCRMRNKTWKINKGLAGEFPRLGSGSRHG